MKIVAFAGSNSSTSINLQLVKFVLTYFKEYEVDLLDLNDFEMPLYSIDRERANGFPAQAHAFLAKLSNADAIVVSLAEHNRSYTVAFKNIFDWCSRINYRVFANKPMLLLSTSPGRSGGGNVMAEAKKFFPEFAASILQTFSLPQFEVNFDRTHHIISEPALLKELEGKIVAFQASVSS